MTQNKKMTNDSGRSMVEMLGVLAVIGVLSIAGVAGYTTAMNKHRANEILNGASVRAVVVSTQLQKNKDVTPTLAEFGSETVQGVTYTASSDKENDQFTLTLTGLTGKTEVCSQMKNIVGEDGIVHISDDCGKLTYNNDLSAGVTVAPPCSLQASDCLSGALQSGECACAPATAGTACSKYNINECGVGYYCAFDTDVSDTSSGTGTCTEISGATPTTGGYTIGGAMNWWSAYSFCLGLGNGHQLMRLSTLDIGLPDTTVGYCDFPGSGDYAGDTGYSGGSFTNEAAACKTKEGTTMTPDNTYASKWAVLKTAIGEDYYWTQDLKDSSIAWRLSLDFGFVSDNGRANSGGYALCE